MRQTKVINFFAGPNAGKSTCAGELFGYMKRKEINCEYVQEKAKEYAWENDTFSLSDQLSIFAEQNRRQYRLIGKTDYIITDSPIFLGAAYFPGSMPLFKELCPDERYDNFIFEVISLTFSAFMMYNNYNYFVRRGQRKFQQEGRMQDYAGCLALDDKVKELLKTYNVDFTEIDNIYEVIEDLGI